MTWANVWNEKILNNARSFLNTEFAGNIQVYVGGFKNLGGQSIRLDPIKSERVRGNSDGTLRDYQIDVSYTFKENVVKKDAWEHILRQLSHIEALFFANKADTSGTYFNGRLIECLINEKTESESLVSGLNVIRWDWRVMGFSQEVGHILTELGEHLLSESVIADRFRWA